MKYELSRIAWLSVLAVVTMLPIASRDALAEQLASQQIASTARHDQSLNIVDRASQTMELHNALPQEFRHQLADMGEYQKQATVRLLAFGIVLEDEGWQITDHQKDGNLGSDARTALEVNLPPGNYMAVGVCDDDCKDLDVYTFGPGDAELGRDIETDAEAVVPFTVSDAGQHVIGASMESCEAAVCAYRLQIFESK
ncbi:MAG: hypothetical protein U5K38_08500 [Woeseiaceae bacterium]|nr:hypothetical protein [Woeseiaceae bacterium]